MGGRAGGARTLWKARHNIYYAIMAMRPKLGSGVPTFACRRPRSPNASSNARGHEEASFFSDAVGHVGDGNFHMGLVIDPANAAEMAEAEAFNERLVKRAIAMDGTCTGEHGIGTGKREYMRPSTARRRSDARDQEGARPQGHPESRQDPISPVETPASPAIHVSQ